MSYSPEYHLGSAFSNVPLNPILCYISTCLTRHTPPMEDMTRKGTYWWFFLIYVTNGWYFMMSRRYCLHVCDDVSLTDVCCQSECSCKLHMMAFITYWIQMPQRFTKSMLAIVDPVTDRQNTYTCVRLIKWESINIFWSATRAIWDSLDILHTTVFLLTVFD